MSRVAAAGTAAAAVAAAPLSRFFSCQMNDAGGPVVCWKTGSITAGVLFLSAQCFSCGPPGEFSPCAPVSPCYTAPD